MKAKTTKKLSIKKLTIGQLKDVRGGKSEAQLAKDTNPTDGHCATKTTYIGTNSACCNCAS